MVNPCCPQVFLQSLLSDSVVLLVFVASRPCVWSVHACFGHMLHSTNWLSHESQKIRSSQRFISSCLRSKRNDRTPLSWKPCWLVDPSREVDRKCLRAMHQQLFTAALEWLDKQNVELQNELAQSRQQAANELATLRQEVQGAPLRGTQTTGVGVDTRLLGKPSDFSRAQDA